MGPSLLGALLALAACRPPAGHPSDGGGAASGNDEAGDSGPLDSGPSDSGPLDSGPTDSGALDSGDSGEPDTGGAPDTFPQPDFTLLDENPSSPRYGEVVSPRDYLEQVSGWYFTHAT